MKIICNPFFPYVHDSYIAPFFLLLLLLLLVFLFLLLIPLVILFLLLHLRFLDLIVLLLLLTFSFHAVVEGCTTLTPKLRLIKLYPINRQ